MKRMIDPYIVELEQEAVATRRVLERVPNDSLGWRPHPKSMTLGQLSQHVAEIPGRIADILSQGEFDFATTTGERRAPGNSNDLVPLLEQGLLKAKEALDALDDTRALSNLKFVHGAREMMSLRKIAVVRTIMLNHWYHHRGELVVYLRMLDVPIPSVYGGSADENPFRP